MQLGQKTIGRVSAVHDSVAAVSRRLRQLAAEAQTHRARLCVWAKLIGLIRLVRVRGWIKSISSSCGLWPPSTSPANAPWGKSAACNKIFPDKAATVAALDWLLHHMTVM